MFIRYFFVVFALIANLFFVLPAFGQLPNYKSCLVPYDQHDPIYAALHKRLMSDKKNIRGPKKNKIKSVYKERTANLKQKLTTHKFLHCDVLERYLNAVLEKVTATSPDIRKPDRILIEASGKVNAYCFGEGTLVVTLGLLRRVKYEDELAFILSHEMAHYHLDHVNQKIRNTVLKYSSKSSQIQAIKNGNVEALQSFIYDDFTYTKEAEKEADSLGLTILLKNAYSPKIFEHALIALDSLGYGQEREFPNPKDHFDFSRYPFQEDWLKASETSLFNDKAPVFLFNRDSVSTHPQIEERISFVKKSFARELSDDNYPPFSVVPQELDTLIDLELLGSVYKEKEFAHALYYGLAMIEKSPQNEQLKFYIGNLLIEIYKTREAHEFGKYVPPHMDQEAPLYPYVTFLNNLRKSEVAELAYHYVQTNIKFDASNENHYLLFWKVSDISGRPNVAIEVKKAYRSAFPHGGHKELYNLN